MNAKAACEGAPTITESRACVDFETCQLFEQSVRWDLVDDPFFGFSKRNCTKVNDHCGEMRAADSGA